MAILPLAEYEAQGMTRAGAPLGAAEAIRPIIVVAEVRVNKAAS